MDGFEGLFNAVDDFASGLGRNLSLQSGGTDPATLARAAQGSSLLSTGLDAIGDVAARIGRAQSYGYSQSAAQINANSALAAGYVNEEAEKIKTGQLLSEQNAQQASSGFDVASSSFRGQRASTAALGALDAAMIHYNAQREAYGYQVQAAGYKAAKENQLLGAIGDVGKSLVSGATALRGNATLNAKMGIGETPSVAATSNLTASAAYAPPLIDSSLPGIGTGENW